MAEEKSDKATDAAVFGTVQSHNIVTTMTKVTEAADVKFGACASLLDIRQAEWTRTAAEVANHTNEAASSRAPWSEYPTVRAEMEANAAKLLGWLKKCLSPEIHDWLNLEGKLIVRDYDYVATIRGIVRSLKEKAVGAGSGAAQQTALSTLLSCKPRAGESLDSYLIRFGAVHQLLNPDTVPAKLAASILVGSLEQQRELYKEVMRYIPADGYADIPAVITRAHWVMDFISAKSSSALTMMAVEGEEIVAAASDKDLKPKCNFCSAKANRAVYGHADFDKEGNPHCYKMRDAWAGLSKYVEDHPAPERKVGSNRKKVNYDKKDTLYSNSTYSTYTNHPDPEPMYAVQQSGMSRETVLCDTGSTITVFNNKEWLSDMTRCGKIISGVGGQLHITHKGKSIYGTAYLCEELPVSVISTNAMRNDREARFEVAYHYATNTFTLTGEHMEERFTTTAELNVPHQITKPVRLIKDNESIAAITLKPKDGSRISRKVVAAAELHRRMNHIPYRQLAQSIKAGVLNTDVSATDVILAETEYPCPVCIATRAKHDKRGGQYQPANLPGQHLRCDIVFIRGAHSVKKPYHLVTDERTNWTHTERLVSTKAADIIEVQRKVVSTLRSKGMIVEKMFYDDDKTVAATAPALGEMGVQIKQWAAMQHEVEAENRFQTGQRDMAAAISDLEFVLPDFLLPDLFQDTCEVRNTMVNAKTGSESPYTIMENDKPLRHGAELQFGDIVWAEVPIIQGNPLAPKRAHAIVVGRDFSTRGKCKVFFLHNKSSGNRVVYPSDIVRNPGQAIYDIINEMTTVPYDKHEVLSRQEEEEYHMAGGRSLNIEEFYVPTDQSQVNVWRANQAANAVATARKRTAYQRRQTARIEVPDETVTDDIQEEESLIPGFDTVDCPTATPKRKGKKSRAKSAPEATLEEESRYKPRGERRNLIEVRSEQGRADEDEHVIELEREELEEGNSEEEPEQAEEKEDQSVAAEQVEPRRSGRFKDSVCAVTEQEYKNPWLAGKEKKARNRSKDAKLMFTTILKRIQDIKDVQTLKEVCFMNLTLNQLLNKGEKGEKAVMKEVRNIINADSLRPRKYNELTEVQRKEAITAFMFGKEKLNKELKARNVMNGAQLVDRPEYRDMVSPTANKMTTIAHLAVASHEKRKYIMSADFPSAYLKVDRAKHAMPREFTRITGKLAEIMVKEEPTWREYVHNGAIYFEITKSIYGLTESAALWYKELRVMLLEMGYEQQVEVDPCLFIHPITKSAVNIHVDDCLCSFTTKKERDRVSEFFEKHKCTIQEGSFTFLGMDIWQRPDKIIQMNMETYLVKYVKENMVTGHEEYPIKGDFMSVDNSEKADTAQQKRYVASVMSLMYAAVRVRIDILFAVAILSQHCKCPTKRNVADLEHLERYVNRTVSKGLTLDTESLDIHVWADASFMLHPDRKGQTGVAVTLGANGPCIAPKSSKTRMLASSSTGAETISCYESTPLLRLASGLMKAFGHPSLPSMRQDNQSAIAMMETGGGTGKHTKHFDLRLKILQEMIQNNEFATVYTPTDTMLADVFTKPMTGKKYKTYMDALMCTPKEQQKPQNMAENEEIAMMTACFLLSTVQSSRGCAKEDPHAIMREKESLDDRE